jgi:ABC-2 type transport system ATP-binding protein
MPYHNAVAVRIAAVEAERVAGALAALAGVVRVERGEAVNGHIRLRALPKPGVTIAADVGALLRDQSIVVEELLVERGKLDDVFREITTSSEGARHA